MKNRFVDEISVRAIAGQGGNGAVSFRREKYIPKGGPDGGDGGNGGSVYLKGSTAMNTLFAFTFQRVLQAANGQKGRGKQQSGQAGQDLTVKVPLGTCVYDENTQELIGELLQDDETLLVAKGGKGGLGNVHFKSSTNRTPRQSVPATLGENRPLRLSLSLLADVGLLGLPNAGKSSLIQAMTMSGSKVGHYPFTTLNPELGVWAEKEGDKRLVIADIPGLIEGAHQGVGLGVGFLSHLVRCQMLWHIVDISEVESLESFHAILKNITLIENELKAFIHQNQNRSFQINPKNIEQIPRYLLFNKVDLLSPSQLKQFRDFALKHLNQKECFFISALKGQGLERLASDTHQKLHTQYA